MSAPDRLKSPGPSPALARPRPGVRRRLAGRGLTLVEPPFDRLPSGLSLRVEDRVVSRREGPAFTLVELLVVIAVIALLVAVLLPSLARARGMTMRVLCGGNLRQVDVAMNLYLGAHGDTYPCAQDPISTSPYYWLWMGRGWRGLLAPFLDTAVNRDSPSVLFCPADPAGKDKYEATSYAYSLAFYHSSEQIDAATSKADTYANPHPFVAQQAKDVARPSGKILLGEWTSNHDPVRDDQGWWCWGGTRNFLLADGQWRYVPAGEIHPARDGFPDPNLTASGVQGADLGP